MMQVEPAAGRRSLPGAALAYVRGHWRGEQPLALAFWGNFVAVTLLAWLAGWLLRQSLLDRPVWMVSLALLQFAGFWLFLWPWQLVGVVRSAERDVAAYRHGVVARLAPLAVALSLLGALPHGVEVAYAVHGLLSAPPPVAEPRAYRLRLSADGRVIHVSGFLDFGVTRDFRAILEHNEDVHAVVLDSGGGPVYEGRALGNVIRRAGLDTYSQRGCSSACTTAFIGGRRRWLAPDAQLGFHQYKLDAVNVHPFLDIAEEQQRDLDIYAARGIDRAFLQRVFHKPHSDIWFPSMRELREAGVIHGVLDRDRALDLGLLP